MSIKITESMFDFLDENKNTKEYVDEHMMQIFLFQQPKESILDMICGQNIGEMAEFYLESEDSFYKWIDSED